MKGKFYNEVMPQLMKKYKFGLKDPIMKIMNEIITDPKDLDLFQRAFKYPNKGFRG